MPQYTPPPQVQTEIRTNVFRPDGRDRIEYSADYLTGDGLAIGLTRYDYRNPRVGAQQVRVEFLLGESTSTSGYVGAAVTEDGVVPEFGVSTVLLDSDSTSVRVYYSQGLVLTDPRAVEALIQSKILGISFGTDDLTAEYRINFNSDAVEVHEGWLNVKLTNSDFLSLRSYLRVSSAESGFYWSPPYFFSTGVLVGYPIPLGNDATLRVGAQPGLILEDDGVSIGAPVGAQLRYNPSDELRLAADIGYAYGMNARLSLSYTF